jgi:hypothetical protein
MATMADLDELALAMPQATKELSDDGRPAYHVHGKLFCFHRGRRRDAIDPDTGERLDDVLMFRVADLGVKELLLADEREIFFTTPHFDGYPAVLMHIPDLARLDRDELEDLVVEAWLTRAQKARREGLARRAQTDRRLRAGRDYDERFWRWARRSASRRRRSSLVGRPPKPRPDGAARRRSSAACSRALTDSGLST